MAKTTQPAAPVTPPEPPAADETVKTFQTNVIYKGTLYKATQPCTLDDKATAELVKQGLVA